MGSLIGIPTKDFLIGTSYSGVIVGIPNRGLLNNDALIGIS